MTTISAKDARKTFSELISNVAYSKEHVVITRNGKKMAALVPMEALDLLESIIDDYEDREDLKAAKESLESIRTEGTIPWEKVKAELGFD